jgi:Ycf4
LENKVLASETILNIFKIKAMITQPVSNKKTVLRYAVLGSRRLSNFFWATVVSIGGIGFFLAGLSSYLKVNLLPFKNALEIVFVPQGLALGFYGVAAILLATYLWLVIALDVGGGYNEFNRDSNRIQVFRWGFIGKNRNVEVSCRLNDAQAVRVVIREGLNPKRAIYLRIKGRGEIPLSRVGQPLPLAVIENEAAEIASFLGVPLEGL